MAVPLFTILVATTAIAETDLAFTEFFGGFNLDFYEAYNAAYPLDSGYEQRKTLYNLYHSLNHFNLFRSTLRPSVCLNGL